MGTKIKYKIKFSPEDLKPEEQSGGIKTKGDAEKFILKSIINAYGSKIAKNIEEFAIAADLIDMVKHSELEIVIDSEDKKIIEKGFEETLKIGRPQGWIEYYDFFKQLRNPEVVEEK